MHNRRANIHIDNLEQFVKAVNTLGYASVETTLDSYEMDEKYCPSEFPKTIQIATHYKKI